MTDQPIKTPRIDCVPDVPYESYGRKLVAWFNSTVAEPKGLPRKLPPGAMCISCGSRVSIAGTLPCDH